MTQFKLSELVYPKKLSWDNIFIDLDKAGVTPSEISELLGVGWSTLQKWRNGTEPKYSVGVSILTIHARYCGEDSTFERITQADNAPALEK